MRPIQPKIVNGKEIPRKKMFSKTWVHLARLTSFLVNEVQSPDNFRKFKPEFLVHRPKAPKDPPKRSYSA